MLADEKEPEKKNDTVGNALMRSEITLFHKCYGTDKSVSYNMNVLFAIIRVIR